MSFKPFKGFTYVSVLYRLIFPSFSTLIYSHLFLDLTSVCTCHRRYVLPPPPPLSSIEIPPAWHQVPGGMGGELASNLPTEVTNSKQTGWTNWETCLTETREWEGSGSDINALTVLSKGERKDKLQ